MPVSRTTCMVVEKYLSALDCPRSLAVWLMFTSNEHDQIAELECHVNDYQDVEQFRHAYLATKFLSKSDFLSMKVDKKSEALKKFFEAEEACGSINRRGYHWKTITLFSSEWLHHAIIRKIGSVLREFDPEEMVDLSNWGPGVSLDIRGSDTSSVKKFQCEIGTTRPLHDLMSGLYAAAYPSWTLPNQKIHAGNKIVTVPKTFKIDRTIAIEPGLNIWFQKGIGRMIRKRLLRSGVDLSSQTRNQLLAREGSKNNELATVDFSSASDTIAYSTVKELLPPQWFKVMDIMRSPLGSLDGKIVKYEKFSSMGNGFTFELETLIFFAIAHACVERLRLDCSKISVFGDDVIIPSDAYPLFQKTCAFYGFSVNDQKSFSSGPFRESCGAHWFMGVNCKPFFLRREISDLHEKMKVFNGIRRMSFCGDPFPHCDARFKDVLDSIIGTVRKPHRISDGYGDGGFIDNFDASSPAKARHGIEGYFAYSLVATPKRYSTESPSLLLARLRDRSDKISFGNEVNLRSQVRFSKKKILIRRWADLGPWL